MAEKEKSLIMRIITPDGDDLSVECDSARINISDGVEGSKGGSFGIRRGQAETVFLVAKGKTLAFNKGELIFSAQTGDGFATMDGKTLTVTVESLSVEAN